MSQQQQQQQAKVRTAKITLPNRGVGPEFTICHISDTHCRNNYPIPKCDALIHSGDWTNGGRTEEHQAFNQWLRYLHSYIPIIIVLSGNHERGFDKLSLQQQNDLIFAGMHVIQPKNEHEDVYGQKGGFLLHDRMLRLAGITLYGCTTTANCGPAYHVSNEQKAANIGRIPKCDLLVAHGPPYAIGDLAWYKSYDEHYFKKRYPPNGICPSCNAMHEICYDHWGEPLLNQQIAKMGISCCCFGHVHDEEMLEVRDVGNSVKCLMSNGAMDLAHRSHLITFAENKNAKAQTTTAAAGGGGGGSVEVDEEPGLMTNEASLSLSSSSSYEQEGEEEGGKNNKTSAGSKEDVFLSTCARLDNAQFVQLVAATSSKALDRDWYDEKNETVLLWRRMKNCPVNQLWRFELIRPVDNVSAEGLSLPSGNNRGIQCRISTLYPKWEGQPQKSKYSYGVCYLAVETNMYFNPPQGSPDPELATPGMKTHCRVRCVTKEQMEKNAKLEAETVFTVVPVAGSFNQQSECIQVHVIHFAPSGTGMLADQEKPVILLREVITPNPDPSEGQSNEENCEVGAARVDQFNSHLDVQYQKKYPKSDTWFVVLHAK